MHHQKTKQRHLQGIPKTHQKPQKKLLTDAVRRRYPLNFPESKTTLKILKTSLYKQECVIIILKNIFHYNPATNQFY
jgi:hypothetical protein